MAGVIVVATSFIGWFDEHQGFSTVLLTFVLVVVTMYYAKQNRNAVDEMRKARKLSVMPKLALEFSFIGPVHVNVAVKNIGPGVALDLDLSLIYDPIEPSDATEERRWRRSVLASGEQREFGLPRRSRGIEMMASTYKAIRLTGSMKDSTGATHAVSDSLDDLAEWFQILKQASEQWTVSPEQRFADALANKINPDFGALTRAVDEVNETLREVGQLEPRGPRARLRRQKAPPTVATDQARTTARDRIDTAIQSLYEARRLIVAAIDARRPKRP